MKKIFKVMSNNIFILKYYFKFAPFYFISNTLFCIFVAFVDTLSGAISVQYIFNGLQNNMSILSLLKYIFFVGLFILARHSWGALCEYHQAISKIKVNAGLRKIIFEHARNMDIEYYEMSEFYDEFVWASSQADEQIFCVFNNWKIFIARLSEIMFVGGFVLANDILLMLFASVILLIRFMVNIIISKRQYSIDLEIKPLERKRDYITRVFYLAEYAKEIRLSEMHKLLYSRLKKTMKQMTKIHKEKGFLKFILSAMSSISNGAILEFGMYVYLCYKAIVMNSLQYGDVAALIYSINTFSYKMKQFIDVFSEFVKSSLYIEKFMRFLKYKPIIEHQTGKYAPKDIQTLTFKNVSFKYDNSEDYILKNISFSICPGEKVAIVGYNGAGKSTLIKLIMRLYNANSGEIMLGNINIKDYDVNSYRDNFGCAFQDYNIFAGSIAENVVMRPIKHNDKDNILKSLKRSGLYDKVHNLNCGINTILTREFDTNGINLSGGEEQKIALSRVFVKNCNYIILDEPSAALDPISEYNLNKEIITWAKDKTVIFVSHRLSTTYMADKIYVFEKGEIVETGTHDELMKLNGKYADMFNKQASSYL